MHIPFTALTNLNNVNVVCLRVLIVRQIDLYAAIKEVLMLSVSQGKQ